MSPPLKAIEIGKDVALRWEAQTNEPLVMWEHKHSYDTAAECEAGRRQHIRDTNDSVVGQIGEVVGLRSARCIRRLC